MKPTPQTGLANLLGAAPGGTQGPSFSPAPRARIGLPAAHWRSLAEATGEAGFREQLGREFAPGASEWETGLSRRNFLKVTGASLGLAGLTACTRQPPERIVPYVQQPEQLVPGRPLVFATAMTLGGFATGLLVESHEGHPTKIEGNPGHGMSGGATNVFHQAALLDLYDPERPQAILEANNVSSWSAFLSALNDALAAQQPRQGAGLRILTETVTSPTLHAQLTALSNKFPRARWHQFEPLSRDNVREGAKMALGEIVETHHDFSKAQVILSLESDFLYSHPAALRYARDFADRRRAQAGRSEMNRLYVVESTPTITGSNADHRLPLRAEDIEALGVALAVRLGALPGSPANRIPPSAQDWVAAVADDLRQHMGASVVLAGETQPPAVHALAHNMNRVLRNLGTTVTYAATAEAQPVNQLESLRQLKGELETGQVEFLLVLGGNPVFTAPADFDFARCLAKAKWRVHLGPEVNETSVLCQWHIPQNHFLESWSDARAFDGTVSIIQPLIMPLYPGKSAHELIDAMVQPVARSDYEIVRDFWRSTGQWTDFEKGWRRALHDGWVAGTALPVKSLEPRPVEVAPEDPDEAAGVEVTFRPDPTVLDGRFANNGWLQELGKPLTKLAWDNALLLSSATARQYAVGNGDIVEVELGGRRLRAPVWVTPGQADASATLHLGYGRTRVGSVGQGTGFNAYGLRTSQALWQGSAAKLTKTRGRYLLVSTQSHHVIDSEERQILREATLAEIVQNPALIGQSVESPGPAETLFDPAEHHTEGNHWGMAIDLTACIGCSACVLACQSENNIPVVGKAQVARHREMQWIRVDTYFKGEVENPAISHQPVPCMHCENAPCELVCPVGATVHDREGLNVQVYNRCIGTRYCSNNCPYKVRRFNFLQFADYDNPAWAPLRNPNVTVRWRGVMEKCTYCVQRISAARIAAKEENRPIREGEIQTACQQVCPAEAIVFGDIHDPTSRVAKLKALPLNYSMMGHLNTRPRTTYLARLRNPNPVLTKAEPPERRPAAKERGGDNPHRLSRNEPELKVGTASSTGAEETDGGTFHA